MDWSAFASTVNWKTSAFAAGYVICSIVGYFVPTVQAICGTLETLAVAGGIVSAADANRVNNVVKAVDYLLIKSKVDPNAIPPEPVLIPATPTTVQ